MTKFNYGLPYMGSKNSIAHLIINFLPKQENFYDLFAGGCAITHCALILGKWENYYFNDIEGGVTQLFLDAINGKFKNETRWISREDFFKLKDEEPYVKYCWSFGNKGTTYLYGKDIEPFKKAYHYAIFFNDYSLFYELGINIPKVKSTNIHQRKLLLKKELLKYKKRVDLQRLESLERLERLQSLQSLQSLERLELDYQEVKIKPNSVIYCDIPYENTAKYSSGSFDHKRFYDWANNQKELVVISSYDITDDRFICVYCINKNCTLQQGGSNKKKEKLFIPKNQINLFNKLTGRNIKDASSN